MFAGLCGGFSRQITQSRLVVEIQADELETLVHGLDVTLEWRGKGGACENRKGDFSVFFVETRRKLGKHGPTGMLVRFEVLEVEMLENQGFGVVL